MNAKERNAFLLENGICTTCGKAWAAPNHHSCLSCLDNFKIIYEQRKAKGKMYYQRNIEAVKAQHKERYAKLKELGLCVVCGKPTDGKRSCKLCRAKKNARDRRRYHERKKQDAI